MGHLDVSICAYNKKESNRDLLIGLVLSFSASCIYLLMEIKASNLIRTKHKGN